MSFTLGDLTIKTFWTALSCCCFNVLSHNVKSQVGRLVGWLLQGPVDVIKNPGSCQPALCSSSLSCVGFILHSLLWGPRLVPAFPSISKTSNGKRPFPFLRFIFAARKYFPDFFLCLIGPDRITHPPLN